MPSVAVRVFRALFPLVAVPVSTLPTLAAARAQAALLVARGQRIAIARTTHGFTVLEVRA